MWVDDPDGGFTFMGAATMWHAFGGLGHWTEWHVTGRTMRDVLEDSREKIKFYGHAFVENPTGELTWFVSKTGKRTEIRPYRPLQSDFGVSSPSGD